MNLTRLTEFIVNAFPGECSFAKVCENYSKDSNTCNKTRGYYGKKRARCYREIKESIQTHSDRR